MISIIIPVYNEELVIRQSVFALNKYLLSLNLVAEIILINNGSTDKTEEVCKELLSENTIIKLHTLPFRSVGKAFARGVQVAKFNFIISLDADLSSNLTFIEQCVDLLHDYDVVIGSKVLGLQRRSYLRVIASQTYIAISQALFGLTVSDFSIGCKGYRRESISPILDYLDSWTGYVFEIVLYGLVKPLNIVQIGVTCSDFRKSRFNLLHEGVFRYFHLFKCWRIFKTKNSWLYLN